MAGASIRTYIAAQWIVRKHVKPTLPGRFLPARYPQSCSQITMKRSMSAIDESEPVKKQRVDEKDPYSPTGPGQRPSPAGSAWPAPEEQIELARSFILQCVSAQEKTLIVPDKDADGLTSGSILWRTLVMLGLEPSLIEVHLLSKGTTVHDDVERQKMEATGASYIFILDQGSRNAPPVIDRPHRALVIDHHWAREDDFPKDSQHVTACNSPPVATCSLLTYLICTSLHEDVEPSCDWLCAMGTHGDLGTSLKWEPPFPDMKNTFKKYTKKSINDAVSLINAPRRTASFSVPTAWAALSTAKSPVDVLSHEDLLDARAEVNAEVERCTHAAPKFSSDGRIAVFRISSQAQVHPVIATRWAGHLKSSKLQVILVANDSHVPGKVSFSCRIPRCARSLDPPVNIIAVLEEIAKESPDDTFRDRLGESFARGHKEASGGIIPHAEFEELMEILEVGHPPKGGARSKQSKKPKQSNTLMNYFGKPKAG